MKILNLMIILQVISLQVVDASELPSEVLGWKFHGKHGTSDIFSDPKGASGPWDKREIITKINRNGTDAFPVSTYNVSVVNCLNKTYQPVKVFGYTQKDLLGDGRLLKIPPNQIITADPISNIKASIFNSACAEMTGYANYILSQQDQPVAQGGNNIVSDINKLLIDAAQASQNQSTNMKRDNKPSFIFFGKKELDNNLYEAFYKKMTNDERLEIAWNFIFAHNVLWFLEETQGFNEYKFKFNSAIPLMREGVEKYNNTFKSLSSTLGVPIKAVMLNYNIIIGENGSAWFERSPSMTDAPMREYIWYHGGMKGFRPQTLNSFYMQNAPDKLYSTFIDSEIRKIEKINTQVVQHASRIELRLASIEADLLKKREEEALRAEENKKRIALEEAARIKAAAEREAFLKTPAGRRQVAAEEQAERARQLKFAKEYPFYAVVTCGNNFPIFACFSGNVPTELELTNGAEYKMYTFQDLMYMAGSQRGLVLDLRNKFRFKMQNSSDSLILNLKIYDRNSDRIIYEKSAARFGVIGFSR